MVAVVAAGMAAVLLVELLAGTLELLTAPSPSSSRYLLGPPGVETGSRYGEWSWWADGRGRLVDTGWKNTWINYLMFEFNTEIFLV